LRGGNLMPITDSLAPQEVVLRDIRPPPAIVRDIGGAAGVYALWLAELGYEVHLIDAAPRRS
jgi:2-polyprenyl-3-methyl-5-hydroxy-6-metoxy-1,4-benzoquinol methylase